MKNIRITNRSLVEIGKHARLTHAIFDFDIPAVTSTVLLDHYTDSAGFKGIMETEKLYLSPLALRLKEGELMPFAQEHCLKGYLDRDLRPTNFLRKMANDLFYFSFSKPEVSDHLWARFGDNCNGYRLRFEVTPKILGSLREIRYGSEATLLSKVNDALKRSELPSFIPRGISSIGSFYLPMTWVPEKETRLLAQRFSGGSTPIICANRGEVWPIPIGRENQVADLKLVQIGVRRLCGTKVRSKLPEWCACVPVVTD